MLTGAVDTVYAAPDDHGAFALGAGRGGVWEEDGGVGALHDALHVGALATNDEQVVLGGNLQVHAHHQVGLQCQAEKINILPGVKDILTFFSDLINKSRVPDQNGVSQA